MSKLKRAIVKILMVFFGFLAGEKALAQELRHYDVKVPTELVKEIKELNFLIKETREIPKGFIDKKLDDKKLKEILEIIPKEIENLNSIGKEKSMFEFDEKAQFVEALRQLGLTKEEFGKKIRDYEIRKKKEKEKRERQRLEEIETLKDIYQLIHYIYYYEINEKEVEKMFKKGFKRETIREAREDIPSMMSHFDNMHIYWHHLVLSKIRTKALKDVRDLLKGYLKQEMIKDMTKIVKQFEKVKREKYTETDYMWMRGFMRAFNRGNVFSTDRYLWDKYGEYMKILRSAGYY